MGEEEATGNSLFGRLSPASIKRKGGFRATGFIYGLVALENMGFISNIVTMFTYFFSLLSFNIPGAANTVTNFMGSTFLLSLIGAFISDTFLSRFHTVLIFGAMEVVAFMLMTIQAHNPDLHPKPCVGKESCMEGGIAFMFYFSLSLLALGCGGVRGALAPFGADQFDKKNPKELKAQGSYFNWLLLSTTLGATVGIIGIVWVSTKHGWWWGYFIATIGCCIGYAVFLLGKPFYRIQVPKGSPLLSIVQVLVVATKNRKLKLPENPDDLHENSEKAVFTSPKLSHTSQFSWLDKAAVVPEGSKSSELTPWELCTVTQVEEVKILTRMLPIILSTVIMNTCLAQLQTFSQAQGYIMNKKLGKLNFPEGSIPVIPLVFMSILVPIYELFFVPFARKITNHPSGIPQLQRVGVGLVLSAISMAIAGIVEVKRRNQSRINPLEPISLFWLSFQYGIFGVADMFTLVGLLEFFYKEAPEGLKSLSTSFTWISMSLGYFLSSVLVDAVNSVTKRVSPSKKGWITGLVLDDNNLNLFYWLLAILSVINFAVYLYLASMYKYKKEDDGSMKKTEMASTTTTSVALVSASEVLLPVSTQNQDEIATMNETISAKANDVTTTNDIKPNETVSSKPDENDKDEGLEQVDQAPSTNVTTSQ